MKDIELINLTLDEIRRSATIVNDTIKDAEIVKLSNKGKKDGGIETLSKIQNDNSEALTKLRKSLRKCLNDIAEYQNCKDMWDGVDIALSENPYDLIFERKTEKDYE